jgi:hypothetical protein
LVISDSVLLLQGAGGSRLLSLAIQSASMSIEKVIVQVTILEGKELAAKDRNIGI